MSVGRDEFDTLAYALADTEFDFDAVERGPLRATWTGDNESIAVVDQETGDEVVYSAEDLIRATSEEEVRNARNPP